MRDPLTPTSAQGASTQRRVSDVGWATTTTSAAGVGVASTSAPHSLLIAALTQDSRHTSTAPRSARVVCHDVSCATRARTRPVSLVSAPHLICNPRAVTHASAPHSANEALLTPQAARDDTYANVVVRLPDNLVRSVTSARRLNPALPRLLDDVDMAFYSNVRGCEFGTTRQPAPASLAPS